MTHYKVDLPQYGKPYPMCQTGDSDDPWTEDWDGVDCQMCIETKEWIERWEDNPQWGYSDSQESE